MSGLHEEHNKGKIFISRIFFILSVQAVLVLVIVFTLYYLQIYKYEYFAVKSDNNRINVRIIPPLRGNILDRNDFPLTENVNSYELLLYENLKNNKSVGKIFDVLDFSDAKRAKIEKIVAKNKYRSIISLSNTLTWDELVKIQSNLYRLDGISIEEGYTRRYLYDEEFAHIIGYVASPNESEIEKLSKNGQKKEIIMHPSFKIGKFGLEKTFNASLLGDYGFKKSEVNVFGVPLETIDYKKPTKNKDLKLTLDLDLQSYIYNLVKDKRASVIVMNVNTGEILAMVSTPSFKGNEFIDGISQDYWDTLNNDTKRPMFNKSISALYSPGSTFKPIVAIAGLENGWQEDTKQVCNGKTFFGNREFRCWEKRGHGSIDLSEALMHSCNIYFANLSLFTGIDEIYSYATKFGIGEVFDIGIDGFQKGIMPNREWKKKVYKDVWVKGDTINTGIGQGFLLVNPLQLVVMISRIANNGYPVKPFLLYDSPIREENLALFKQKPLASPNTIKTVKKGLYMVLNNKKGTAFWKRIKDKEFEMAGKTGTAQVIALDKKNIMEENNELKEEYKNHALFIGFAPYNNPKYGISVVIEHGVGGSISAAPVASDVLLYVQKRESEHNF